MTKKDAYTQFSTKETPQSEQMRGDQVPNSAGGFTWQVDKWTQLRRFLVLGSEGGTYYIGQKELTDKNAKSVLECIKEDGLRTVNEIVEVSQKGLAPRNDPALFALALVASHGDNVERHEAFTVLPKVARIPTHLYHFTTYVQNMRGWGRGMRNGYKYWLDNKSNETLAYQAIKYQSRDGWSMRDVLRKAHPDTDDAVRRDIYQWITHGWTDEHLDASPQDKALQRIWAYERAKEAKEAHVIVNLIMDYNLPRECIPTEFLNDKEVWGALLQKMPMTAMIRNLGKMTALELLAPMSTESAEVVKRLTDNEQLTRARIHPYSVLLAMKTYSSGCGFRGSLNWKPVREIVDALDEAFYKSFGNVEPTGKRIMLALDVSGSMNSPLLNTNITAREASVAMALVTANVESQYMTTIFSSSGTNFSGAGSGRDSYFGDTGLSEYPLSPRQRLDDVVDKFSGLDFGGTDCALPMLYATERKLEIDAFILYTDNETWAGTPHPVQALQEYRNKFVSDARLVVVGMVGNKFSIADPTDPGMLDVVGFSADAPNVISGFVKGEI